MLTPRNAQEEEILKLDVTDTHFLSLKRVSIANRTHFVFAAIAINGDGFQREMAYRLPEAERRYADLVEYYS
jgi:hypothetical protein